MLSDYYQAMLRTDLPLAAPVGTVRIPLVDGTPLADPYDRSRRKWILPSLLLALLLPALTSHLAVRLVALGIFVVGILAPRRGRRFDEDKAIAFDAQGIWNEWPGGATEPLPWAGLKYRSGRTPHLVAEDGRSLPFNRGTMKAGLDSDYLMALVERLPQIPGATYPPNWALALGALLSFGLFINARETFLLLQPNEPPFSTGRYQFLLSALIGTCLALWAAFGAIWRGPREVQRGPPSVIDPQHRWEVVAHFRAHGFHPPPTPLEPGVVYEYLDAEFDRRQAGIGKPSEQGLLRLGGVIFLASTLGAVLGYGDQKGSSATCLMAGAVALLTLALQCFLPNPLSSSGRRLRVEDDSVYVWSEGEPEQRFDWPPARTREATEFQDWTDELRAGRRRLRIDRRLLVAAQKEVEGDQAGSHDVPVPA